MGNGRVITENRKTKTRMLSEIGIIAAMYTALVLVFAPISFGPLQMRVSEALCVLPFFTPVAVPGLFIGCLISNAIGLAMGTALGIFDVIFGSLATLAAAYLASKIKQKWLVPLPSVLINAFVVGGLLYAYLGVPYWINVLYVGVGQAIACYAFGMPLLFVLDRYKTKIFKVN